MKRLVAVERLRVGEDVETTTVVEVKGERVGIVV